MLASLVLIACDAPRSSLDEDAGADGADGAGDAGGTGGQRDDQAAPVAPAIELDGTTPAIAAPELPPVPLATDLCDEPSYANVAWTTARSAHFEIHFFPGTAADLDQLAILTRLEDAYANIRQALALTAEPTISVHLSPNRLAATTHGKAFGRAWPGADRYEVIYTGADDSYERLRYGHELTHVLEFHLDPSRQRRHPLLVEGLAEYLDQSGRDLHDAYAQQLMAGIETRVRVALFDGRDLNGKNYGRAGSLVQFLVERYGMAGFLDVFEATAVTWAGGCWTHATAGCIATPDALTAMLDGALTATVGEGWSTAQPAWQADVQGALGSVDVDVSAADHAEIDRLLEVMDEAVIGGDAALYRSTMEGFYCEWGGDGMRGEIADRAVSAFTWTRSRAMAIVATGVKNFRTAQVTVRRTDERGLDSFVSLTLEHVPAGWRVAYGPDWY